MVPKIVISVTQEINCFLPGAQSDKDWRDDEEGHGAAMLSLKSQVKLMPVVLSNEISVGKLRRRHPTIMKIQINMELREIWIQTNKGD